MERKRSEGAVVAKEEARVDEGVRAKDEIGCESTRGRGSGEGMQNKVIK